MAKKRIRLIPKDYGEISFEQFQGFLQKAVASEKKPRTIEVPTVVKVVKDSGILDE